MYGLFRIIKDKLFSGNSRTVKVRKSIIYSALLKFISILVSFYMVRVTYDFLGHKDVYGVWLTILSLLTWINFFDMGLGNSLRNRLAGAIALEDTDKGRIYVSTSYAVMGILVLALLITYLIITSYVNWNKVFNIYLIDSYKLKNLLDLVVIFYLLYFFLSLIKNIAFALQDAVLPALFGVISNITFLAILFTLHKCNMSGITVLGGAYSGISTTILFTASVYLFLTKYKDIMPRFKSVNFNYAPDLFNLGIKFFIVQIAVLIIFSTDNMIITHVLGPAYVTPHQITFKLFSVFTMAANIIMTPLWSAYTDAYLRGEHIWIIKSVKKQVFLMIPLIICVSLMVIFSKQIIALWMGSIEVPFLLIVLMGIYVIISIWNNIFGFLFNGIGKIRLSLGFSVFAAIINIPLSVIFSRYIGLSGVILGTIVSLFVWGFLGPLQFYYIFYSKRKRKILDELFN